MGKHVDLYILSGFLGSGKTTLLQRILMEERQRQRKVAVLMNELGEISVDSTILPDGVPLKELLNGCICCTIQDQLTQQLVSLCQQHEPDVIYIEATGVAHPLEVLEACLTPLMIPYLRTCKTISTVDLLRWRDRGQHTIPVQRLMEDQIRYADWVVVNKIDQLPDKEFDWVEQQMKQQNEHAEFVFTNYAQFDLALLFDQPAQSASFQREQMEKRAHVHQHLHVRSFAYTWEQPIHRQAFEDWLRNSPDQLYRAKGYLRFQDEPQKTYLFQYSYGMPIFTEEYFRYPLTVVFIGEQLDEQVLKRELASL
ncbi:G3E family GTPase [Hazenella coriacea]|uniref:G3E family GTPase n=1 Tax=Hazenella coriacea TaxID=1179467 RepID=A0A4V6NZA9_9BACL|nr:G3E family GTPase [Hazenella coriacea]